jgi:hypothetical protein
METQKTTDQTFNAATQNITGRAISYGMDENTNTKMFKSGTQMQQLSYNSTATSGLHCNHMLHTTVQFVFVTPFTIWLQQGNHQCLFYLFKKRKLFSRNTTVYTCIHINYNKRIQRVTENYTVQQNNFDI